jgi:hypothetical protein
MRSSRGSFSGSRVCRRSECVQSLSRFMRRHRQPDPRLRTGLCRAFSRVSGWAGASQWHPRTADHCTVDDPAEIGGRLDTRCTVQQAMSGRGIDGLSVPDDVASSSSLCWSRSSAHSPPTPATARHGWAPCRDHHRVALPAHAFGRSLGGKRYRQILCLLWKGAGVADHGH